MKVRNKKIIKIVLVVLLILVLLAVAYYAYLVIAFKKTFGPFYCDDLYIKSPDGSYTLIIKEWSAAGGTGAEIYCVKGKYTKLKWIFNTHKLGDTIADDYCLPFKDNNYVITWDDDSVTLKYFSGRRNQEKNDPTTWEVETFKLP